MCDYSRRLVAWLDRELQADEASEMERHFAACPECRNCTTELDRVSGVFEDYCEALAQTKEERKASRVAPILWAAAAAIVLAVMFAYPRGHVASPRQQPSVTAVAKTNSSPSLTVKAAENAPAPSKADHYAARRQAADRSAEGAASPRLCSGQGCSSTKVQGQSANWVAEEPAIQIAIPSEAMFPPGAVPEGVNFVADVSIGADGRVEQLRLRPRPARFERRTDQP
jgi:anti-sigma factor RsiW